MGEWVNPFYSRKVFGFLHEQFVESKNTTLQKFVASGKLSISQLKEKSDLLQYSYKVGKVPTFVHSSEFLQVLQQVVGFEGKIKNVEACVFEKGDYTVLADGQALGKGALFLLSVNPGLCWNDEWGGFVSILNGEQEVMRVSPQQNALTIIDYRGLRSFVKYVNHHAKSSFILIRGFLVPK